MQNHCDENECENDNHFNNTTTIDNSNITSINDDSFKNCDNNYSHSIESISSKPGRAERRIEEYLSKWTENINTEVADQYFYYNPRWSAKTVPKRNKSLKYKPKTKTFAKLQIIAEYINNLNSKTNNQNLQPIKYNYADIVDAAEKINFDNPKILNQRADMTNEKVYFEVLQENSKLKEELETKNFELSNIKPRLKFLEDNYDDFVFMKKEMKKLKKIKIKSGELIEKGDIGTQTWETAVICSECMFTSQVINSDEYKTITQLLQKGAVIITKKIWSEILKSFDNLRSLISEREKEYENRKEELQTKKLREKITFLEEKLVQRWE